MSLSLLLLRFDIRPSYGEVNEAEPTCLLRTCDQYITGRDLTYERALEIVQNEEYLVAVDADLIRKVCSSARLRLEKLRHDREGLFEHLMLCCVCSYFLNH